MVDAEYLVVGAGATGMAFTDALIDHADVRVALVDRRYGPGGHWLDDYAFVRLHQASAFYGVASTLLGAGLVQRDGPEAGLYERAAGGEVCTYFARVLAERMVRSGKVAFYPNCDYVGDRQFVSRLSGQRYQVADGCRIVDARYLAPDIPAKTSPPFGVAEGVRVIAVNDLVNLGEAPGEFVIVGSGKTATDAVVWLLGNGVASDAIRWVRPRDPWMLNRAVVQPDPAVYVGMVADTMAAAAVASSADELFVRLEEAGVMLRVDQSVAPKMAKTPTLAQWELDLLRQITRVERRGHIHHVAPGRLAFADGEVATRKDAVVVHCAAPGLKYSPLVPVWGAVAIRVQPLRAGFPCFGGGAGRLRRGDPDRRWGEEPTLPTDSAARHADRLVPDAGSRRHGDDVFRCRVGYQGVGRPGRAEPRGHVTGSGESTRAERGAGTIPDLRRLGPVPLDAARRPVFRDRPSPELGPASRSTNRPLTAVRTDREPT